MDPCFHERKFNNRINPIIHAVVSSQTLTRLFVILSISSPQLNNFATKCQINSCNLLFINIFNIFHHKLAVNYITSIRLNIVTNCKHLCIHVQMLSKWGLYWPSGYSTQTQKCMWCAVRGRKRDNLYTTHKKWHFLPALFELLNIITSYF